MPLNDGIKLEAALFEYLLGTNDYEEGTAAFNQKRKARFKAK